MSIWSHGKDAKIESFVLKWQLLSGLMRIYGDSLQVLIYIDII